MKHKEQRILVLFDVQNMYYSAKQLYHKKVNFTNILNQAVSNRRLTRAIAYVIKTDIKEEVNFHDALNKIGIEVKAKDIQIFLGGAKKGDWDIGIAMDAVRLSPKVDVVVLVSGDGDFKDLLQYLQSHGCRAEVIAFGRTTSKHLKETADDFHDLEKNPGKYLIGYKNHGNNNINNINHDNHGKGKFQKNNSQQNSNKPQQSNSFKQNESIKPVGITQTGPSSQNLPKINTSSDEKKPNVGIKLDSKPVVKEEKADTKTEKDNKSVKKDDIKAKIPAKTDTTDTKTTKKPSLMKKLTSRLGKKKK